VSGAVVVVQEVFGVTPWLLSAAARFETEGYKTAVPHLYSRLGDPVFGTDDLPKAREAMATLTGESILEDLDAAIGSTGVRQSRVAVVGFCMGGAVALYAGAMRALGAAVSFYGGGITTSRWEGVPPLVEVAPGCVRPGSGCTAPATRAYPSSTWTRWRPPRGSRRCRRGSSVTTPGTAS
jgi:carboxymethylenebutenolidase